MSQVIQPQSQNLIDESKSINIKNIKQFFENIIIEVAEVAPRPRKKEIWYANSKSHSKSLGELIRRIDKYKIDEFEVMNIVFENWEKFIIVYGVAKVLYRDPYIVVKPVSKSLVIIGINDYDPNAVIEVIVWRDRRVTLYMLKREELELQRHVKKVDYSIVVSQLSYFLGEGER